MRRGALEAVGGYDASYRARGAEGSEDHALYLALAEQWDFTVVPRHLIAYRVHPCAMSRNAERMARSEGLVVADLFRRKPQLSRYRYGRGQAAVHQGSSIAALRDRNWGQFADVLMRSARDGGAWCLFDLIGRRLPKQVAGYCLRKLRPDQRRIKSNHLSLDFFWPTEKSQAKPLQEPLLRNGQMLESAASEDT
jgi:hypothetical protein